jgi:hypothetical protein
MRFAGAVKSTSRHLRVKLLWGGPGENNGEIMGKRFRVKLRRGGDWEVKENAELIDGQIFEFVTGWVIEEDDSTLYAGEMAWIPIDASYPKDAPSWIASGDLEEVTQ